MPSLFSAWPALLFFAVIPAANAADETFVDQFLGSPLLVLAALLFIVVAAFAYRKIRK